MKTALGIFIFFFLFQQSFAQTCNVTNSSTNINICPGSFPYLWNGNSYYSAGDYNVILTNAAGCDSIATLHLGVNFISTSETDIVTCNSFIWMGTTYTKSGSYSDTLTNAGGCDSIATLNLTIRYPSIPVNINKSICSSLLPYSWNGKSYNAAGTYSDTLKNVAGCDSMVTLNLTVIPAVTSTTNISICKAQLPYLWNGQLYNAAGTFNVILTGVSTCDSIATLNLTVRPSVTTNINTSICPSQLPYMWNGQQITSTGVYRDTLVSSVACDSIVVLNLYINPLIKSTKKIFISNTQAPYIWNGKSYDTTGVYKDTLTSVYGCDSIATLILTVITPDSIDIHVCPNNHLKFTANVAGDNYQWQEDTGTGFTDLPGETTDSLKLAPNIPSSSYGYKYRCLVNGYPSLIITLKFSTNWTGTVDSTWENPANWDCGVLPDANTDVIINSGIVILNSDQAVRSLTVNPTASFTIKPPYQLTVTH